MTNEQIGVRLLHIEKLLLGSKKVLTFDEAAEYTGLSKSYLYKLTSANLIPHSKPNGKQIYFDKAELDTWLLRNPAKTNDRLNSLASTYVITNKN